MKKLVRLWKRPCKNGREFKYVLIWNDELGKERWQTLGHTDGRQAEKQSIQKDRELRMGLTEPEIMNLSEFPEDSLAKTSGQVREGTLDEYCTTMNQFIDIVGDIDYRNIRHEHGERFIQACFKRGNGPETAFSHCKKPLPPKSGGPGPTESVDLLAVWCLIPNRWWHRLLRISVEI